MQKKTKKAGSVARVMVAAGTRDVATDLPAGVKAAAVNLGKAAGGAKGAAVALGKAIRAAAKGDEARKAMLAAAWLHVVEAAGKTVSADSLSVYKSMARAAAGIASRGGGRPKGTKKTGGGTGGTGGTGGEDAGGEDIAAATTQAGRFALIMRVMEACGVENVNDAVSLVRAAYKEAARKPARPAVHPAAAS